MRLVLACFIASSVGFAAASVLAYEAPTYTALSGEDADDLRDGGTVRDVRRGNPNRGMVIGLIRAPADQLFEIVLDYENIPQWSSALIAATVLEDSNGQQVVEGETRLPWPITNRTWRIRSFYAPQQVDGHEAWVNRWEYIPGHGNVDDTFGYWLVMPWPDDPTWTYVKYVVNADPGVALPNAILNWATSRALPDLITGLAERHDALY
jgi:hypothetical protein